MTQNRSHPIWALITARLREFTREPAAVFWVYVFPLILVVTLGVAFRNQPVETAQVDVVRGGGSSVVAAALEADERFKVQQVDAESSRRRLRSGKTDLVVVVESGSEATYQYSFDPTRPGSMLARNAVDDVLQRAAGREDVVATLDEPFTEPGGRYIDFLIPGLLGMNLMGGGLWGVGFATVDLRIRKLLKRYLATPMNRGHFLFSMMISRFVFIVPEMILLLVFAHFVFGVVIHGSFLVMILLIGLGALQFSGIGLLVGSRAQTLETVSGLMNLVMLPMWITSGIFFSVERFPDFAQPFLKLLPLTPLIHCLRAVMLEATPMYELSTELALIVAWGVVTFVLALWFFRWN